MHLCQPSAFAPNGSALAAAQPAASLATALAALAALAAAQPAAALAASSTAELLHPYLRHLHHRRQLRPLTQLPFQLRQLRVVLDHAYEPGCRPSAKRDRLPHRVHL